MIRERLGGVISCYLYPPYNPSANKPDRLLPLRGLFSHRVITQSYINSRGTSRILHQTPLNQFSPLCYLQRRFRFELCFLFIYFSLERRIAQHNIYTSSCNGNNLVRTAQKTSVFKCQIFYSAFEFEDCCF